MLSDFPSLQALSNNGAGCRDGTWGVTATNTEGGGNLSTAIPNYSSYYPALDAVNSTTPYAGHTASLFNGCAEEQQLAINSHLPNLANPSATSSFLDYPREGMSVGIPPHNSNKLGGYSGSAYDHMTTAISCLSSTHQPNLFDQDHLSSAGILDKPIISSSPGTKNFALDFGFLDSYGVSPCGATGTLPSSSPHKIDMDDHATSSSAFATKNVNGSNFYKFYNNSQYPLPDSVCDAAKDAQTLYFSKSNENDTLSRDAKDDSYSNSVANSTVYCNGDIQSMRTSSANDAQSEDPASSKDFNAISASSTCESCGISDATLSLQSTTAESNGEAGYLSECPEDSANKGTASQTSNQSVVPNSITEDNTAADKPSTQITSESIGELVDQTLCETVSA